MHEGAPPSSATEQRDYFVPYYFLNSSWVRHYMDEGAARALSNTLGDSTWMFSAVFERYFGNKSIGRRTYAFTTKEIELLMPEIQAMIEKDREAQALIDTLPETGSSTDRVVAIETVYYGQKGSTSPTERLPYVPAQLSVYAVTEKGFYVPVRALTSIGTTGPAEEKLALIKAVFEKYLVGAEIKFSRRTSKNGKKFLQAVHSSLPDDIQSGTFLNIKKLAKKLKLP